MTSTIVSNMTLRGYTFFSYPVSSSNWWASQTIAAFRMLSHSGLFKPDKTMMVTRGVRVENFDAGTCTAAGCQGNSLFRVDRTDTGSAWQFNWEDNDGSVVRLVNPSKPAGRYLIGSYIPWWNLDDTCWLEVSWGGGLACWRSCWMSMTVD